MPFIAVEEVGVDIGAVYQGDTFAITFQLTPPTGGDLSDVSKAELVVGSEDTSTVLFSAEDTTVTVLDASSGQIEVALTRSAAQMATVTPNTYIYQLRLYWDADRVTVATGTIKILNGFEVN